MLNQMSNHNTSILDRFSLEFSKFLCFARNINHSFIDLWCLPIRLNWAKLKEDLQVIVCFFLNVIFKRIKKITNKISIKIMVAQDCFFKYVSLRAFQKIDKSSLHVIFWLRIYFLQSNVSIECFEYIFQNFIVLQK